jgi:hypothetical protein
VTVKPSATNYADGAPIADFVKGGKYRVIQSKEWIVGNSRTAYLLDGIMSWVLEQDIVGSGVSNGMDAPAPVAPTPSPVVPEAVVPYPGRVLKKGSKGDDVKRLQRALGVAADGDFGPATDRAVRAYQQRHGLGVDGKVGPQTWNTIF